MMSMNTKSKKPTSGRDRAFQERTGRVGKGGKVTIPREIFENLKLKAGDLVVFTLQKNGVLMKPKRVLDPDRTLANLIKETRAEQAKKPMAVDKILAESKRLARAGAKRAKKLGIKTDVRSATQLIHERRQARKSSS